jgi:hypothetical protein
MPIDGTIEQRLTAVETAVEEIQRRLACDTKAPSWVERFTGAFQDEPAFAEVVEYGRAIRAADRPREDSGA